VPKISGGKFVLIGGASQIGAHIGEQLLSGGAREVVLFDNLSMGSLESMQTLLADPRCTFVRCDVLRLNELFDPLANADGAFSVAGMMATSMGENSWLGIDVNIRGLQNTLESCHYQGVKKLVFSSSVGVYGKPEDDSTDEDSPLRWQEAPPAMALYCASKIMGEAIAKHYLQRHGIDYVALRYSAVYGEHQHGRARMGKKIALACSSIRCGKPVVIDGDGQQVQDYIYAGDAARANLMAMESDVTGESFNICAGDDTSENRIVEIVAAACNSSLRTEYRQNLSGAKLPPVRRQGYSRDKAKRLLDWQPLVSIEEGIGRVLRWTDQMQVTVNPTF
jgi:UDP-glucose 4-epimerase